MAQESKRKYRFKPRFIGVAAILCICAVCAALYSQEQKFKEIKAQEQTLQEQRQALENEEQRLEYMIEYAHTDEFLLQYAREKLGFVMPDDIKFNIDTTD
ncbi:MAG: septum formation initiator family protein [Clostridia bacterium]